MTSEQSKREIPGGLKSILEQDVKLSKEFVELVNKKYPIAAYRSHLKSLEVGRMAMIPYTCLTHLFQDILSWNPLAVYLHCWSLLIREPILLQSPARTHPRHRGSGRH